RSWWPRVGLPGLWFGAALLAKASGMVFGPLCLIAVEAHRMWNTRPWPDYPSAHTNPKRKRGGTADLPRLRFGFVLRQSLRGFVGPGIIRAWLLRASIRDLSQIAAIGFAVTLIYCGCDWRPEPSFVAWAHGLPEGRAHDALVWLSEHLCLFSNAGEGLVRQVKHNMRGHHGSYLLGRAYPQPVWYYFPVALAVKLSLPLLAAPLAVLAARRRAALNWALAVTGALFLFSLNCRVQIGIRLVLPLVVFLVVAVAGGCVGIITQSRPWPRRLWIAGSLAAVLWTSAAAWRAWPEGLCYTNELWGGSDNGYLCLSDSNYDWGQGVKELAAWTRGRGWPQLDVWYFGSDPAVNAAPLRHLPLHLLPIGKPSDVPTFVQSRYLAVGTTLIYGTPLGLPAHRAAVDFLRSRTPVARTATFLIYDLAERVAASPDYSWPHEFQRRLRAHQPEAQAR
ncbi:MAG TPA: hypothetical protein VNH11_26610, partial [Pirellulales bacterium]|nr:hypothetical protein [Pirellulales bacterium]